MQGKLGFLEALWWLPDETCFFGGELSIGFTSS